SVPNVPFANNEFHEAWLPAAVYLQLAVKFPRFAWLALVPLLLFPKNYLMIARGVAAVVAVLWGRAAKWRHRADALRHRAIDRYRIWHGFPTLWAAQDAQAQLTFPWFLRRTARLEIESPGNELWTVQVIHPLPR